MLDSARIAAGYRFANVALDRAASQLPVAVTQSITTALNTELTYEAVAPAARRAAADLMGVAEQQVLIGPSVAYLLGLLAPICQGRRSASGILTSQFYQLPASLTAGVQVQRAGIDLLTGELPPAAVAKVVEPATRLAIIPAADAHLGVITDLQAVAAAISGVARAWLVVDASALVGQIPLSPEACSADVLCADLAPLGVPGLAALAVRSPLMLRRLGVQELGELSSWQPPAAWLAGLVAAVDFAADWVPQERGRRRQRLATSLDEVAVAGQMLLATLMQMLDQVPGHHVVGVSGDAAAAALSRLPQVTLCFPELVGTAAAGEIVEFLRGQGLQVLPVAPSEKWVAMGLDEALAAMVTVKLGPWNTQEHLARLVTALQQL